MVNKNLPHIDRDLSCGVQQASILGLLLFLLYVNDIPHSVSCDLLIYADESCLGFTGKKMEKIKIQLNNDFNMIYVTHLLTTN